ncbi:MAG: hypothetical protein HY666_00610, partial [Chloroflexi bacterium]|nr:hypothetical protein [Chloroflexota bacterium]
MLKHRLLGLSILLLFVATLAFAGCRAAQPTATPVPPTPTKAPAPTVAPVAPAPAATTAPAPSATIAPAPTAAPTATFVPVAQLKLPKIVLDYLAKYPTIYYYTELPLPKTEPKYGGNYVFSALSPDSPNIGTGHWDFRVGGVIGSGGGGCYAGLLSTNVDRFHNRVTHEVL